MDAAAQYRKDAEKCERLAKECETVIARSFLLDAAKRWRQMALEAEHTEPPTRPFPEGPDP